MKKLFFLLVMLCLLITMSSCYNYSSGSQYGRLESIKYFNTEYEEIEGEYQDFSRFDGPLRLTNILNLNDFTKPLNSPAPIHNYYWGEINAGVDVIVRFTIKCNNDCEFNSLHINDLVLEADDFFNVEIDGKYVYLDYLITNIDTNNRIFVISRLTMKRERNNEMKKYNGSTWVESRTYLSGFYFSIKDE